MVMCDVQTRFELRTGQTFPSENNKRDPLVADADGAVDLYFSPKAPAEGGELNPDRARQGGGTRSCGCRARFSPRSTRLGTGANANYGLPGTGGGMKLHIDRVRCPLDMAATLGPLLLPALGCMGSLTAPPPWAQSTSPVVVEKLVPRATFPAREYELHDRAEPVFSDQPTSVRRALHLATTASIEQGAQALDSCIRWCNGKRIEIFVWHSQSGCIARAGSHNMIIPRFLLPPPRSAAAPRIPAFL